MWHILFDIWRCKLCEYYLQAINYMYRKEYPTSVKFTKIQLRKRKLCETNQDCLELGSLTSKDENYIARSTSPRQKAILK